MKKLSLIAAAMVVGVTLQGCVIVTESDWEEGHAQYDEHKTERENRSLIASLPMSLTVAEAKQRLGTPDFTDSWTADDKAIRVIYYRTHRTKADGMTTRDECTPLVFVNDQLVGTGEMALDSVKKSG